MYVSSLDMRERGMILGYRSFTLNTMQYGSFLNYNAVFDIRINHFKHLHHMFTYYVLTCNNIITLCLFKVKKVYHRYLTTVIPRFTVCIIFFHANQIIYIMNCYTRIIATTMHCGSYGFLGPVRFAPNTSNP